FSFIASAFPRPHLHCAALGMYFPSGGGQIRAAGGRQRKTGDAGSRAAWSSPIFPPRMRGTISFHAVDPAVFATLFDPLLAGKQPDATQFLEGACRYRRVALGAARYSKAIEVLLDDAQ